MHRRAFLGCLALPGVARAAPREIGRFRGAASRTSVAMRMVDHRVMAPVEIGGATYDFLLATGAHTAVSRELARELRLRSTGEFAVRGAGEQPVTLERAVLPGMRMGELEIADAAVAVAPLEEMRQAIGFRRLDGVLGYELFRDYVIGIEASVERLQVVRAEGFEYQGEGVVARLEGSSEVPEVWAEIDGVRGRFRVDTGDRAAVTWNAPFAEAWGLRAKFAPHSFGICGWGLGGAVRADWAQAGSLRVSGFEVKPVWMRFPRTQNGAFADERVAGSLGNALWSRFNTWIDVRGRRMMLEPWTTLDAADVHDGAGLWMSEAAEGFRIVDVVERGAAAQAGLRVGDVVVAVNGRLAEGLELPEVRSWLRRPQGVELRVRREQEIRSVRLVARRGEWI